ncbi:MAG: DUF58 domain-containing protein [Nocardioidaceae bacterium]
MTKATLQWQPTATLGRLATVCLIALFVAVVSGHGNLMVLAAPALLWLAAFARPRVPDKVAFKATCDPQRCREGQQIAVELAVKAPSPAARVRATCAAAGRRRPDMQVDPDADVHRWRWMVPVGSWGRRSLASGAITVHAQGDLWAAVVDMRWPKVSVLPEPPQTQRTIQSAILRLRPGTRAGNVVGPGIEAAGVRPYAPGDLVRRVNWRATMRRGQLHVTEFAAEQAQDVVLVVDAMVRTGPAGNGPVDRAVRGAAGLAEAHLDSGDRVGMVTVEPAQSWLLPGVGRRHLSMLLDRLIDLGTLDSVLPPDLSRIPPAVVPTGALVVVLTPLLTEESVGLVGDLRRRGHPVVVVDVLSGEPVPTSHGSDRSALRLWRLDRKATIGALQDRGVLVVEWPVERQLDAALQAAGHGRSAVLR